MAEGYYGRAVQWFWGRGEWEHREGGANSQMETAVCEWEGKNRLCVMAF